MIEVGGVVTTKLGRAVVVEKTVGGNFVVRFEDGEDKTFAPQYLTPTGKVADVPKKKSVKKKCTSISKSDPDESTYEPDMDDASESEESGVEELLADESPVAGQEDVIIAVNEDGTETELLADEIDETELGEEGRVRRAADLAARDQQDEEYEEGEEL
jgi:hypothetical protein